MPRPRSLRNPVAKIKEALDELVSILEKGTAGAKSASRRSGQSSAGKKGGGAKGRQPSVDREQLLALVRKSKRGASAAELAQVLGVETTTLGYHLKQLRAAKKISAKGATSQTRYFAD
jgi:hypothetical protein